MDRLQELYASGLIKDNKTHILLQIPLINIQNVSAVGKTGDDYDADGAMIFIVATVSMYSLGIVAFVAGHIFRKSNNLSTDRQTNVYISTFNRNHLNNLSKLHMLRCMQRKMLARYNMLEYQKNRKVKYFSCNRDECRHNTNDDDIPRIFQDIVSKRGMSSETESSGKCSLTVDDISNCSLTDVSLDVSVVSDDVYICQPISCDTSNGSDFEWCSANEETLESSCEVCSSLTFCKENKQTNFTDTKNTKANDLVENDIVTKIECMDTIDSKDVGDRKDTKNDKDNDLGSMQALKNHIINDLMCTKTSNSETDNAHIENNDTEDQEQRDNNLKNYISIKPVYENRLF